MNGDVTNDTYSGWTSQGTVRFPISYSDGTSISYHALMFSVIIHHATKKTVPVDISVLAVFRSFMETTLIILKELILFISFSIFTDKEEYLWQSMKEGQLFKHSVKQVKHNYCYYRTCHVHFKG